MLIRKQKENKKDSSVDQKEQETRYARDEVDLRLRAEFCGASAAAAPAAAADEAEPAACGTRAALSASARRCTSAPEWCALTVTRSAGRIARRSCGMLCVTQATMPASRSCAREEGTGTRPEMKGKEDDAMRNQREHQGLMPSTRVGGACRSFILAERKARARAYLIRPVQQDVLLLVGTAQRVTQVHEQQRRALGALDREMSCWCDASA